MKGGMPGMPQIPQGLPMMMMAIGAGLIGFGALLIANEKLLIYVVAGLFMLFGLLLIFIGMRAKRMIG